MILTLQKSWKSNKKMAGAGGFEPPNAGIKNRCLNHLATPHSLDNCAKHMRKRERQQAYRRSSTGSGYSALRGQSLERVDGINLDLESTAINPDPVPRERRKVDPAPLANGMTAGCVE